jgi:hypothetical protein
VDVIAARDQPSDKNPADKTRPSSHQNSHFFFRSAADYNLNSFLFDSRRSGSPFF